MAYNPDLKRILQPRTYQEDRAENLRHAFEMFGIAGNMDNFQVQRDPEYDYLARAEQFSQMANNYRSQAMQQRGENRDANIASLLPAAGKGKGGGGEFMRLLRAIAGKESGGNYGAVNPSSGALGKYQIMPANIPSWSQAALGRQVSTQQFLNNPKIQEAIARHRLMQYYSQYGAAGAASAWYSGSPTKWNSGAGQNSQGAYPSIYNYVMAILQAMGNR